MKLLHTADWHLGNSFHGHDRLEEHRHFLDWLLQTLRDREPDALLVAGDIFDTTNPSAAAEALFFDFLEQATEALPDLQIVLTAGNHDSAGRLEAPAPILRRHNVFVRGTVRRTEDGTPDYDHLILPLAPRGAQEAAVVCFALPYLRSFDCPEGSTPEEGLRHYFEELRARFRKSAFRGLPCVAVAHFYAATAEICAEEHSERLVIGGQDRVSADVAGKELSYVALGHIHKAQRVSVQPLTHYAGSALPMSFSEKNYHHGVQWVEIGADGRAAVSRIDYAPLRSLLSIPDRGAAARQEVLAAIAALPARTKKDDGHDWPYLEIKVALRQPEPELLNDVTRALEDKAVRFCRMTAQTGGAEADGAAADEGAAVSLEQLRTIRPLDMAKKVFAARYGEAMPAALEERFNQAVAALQEQSQG